jgi:hypothetical protein
VSCSVFLFFVFPPVFVLQSVLLCMSFSFVYVFYINIVLFTCLFLCIVFCIFIFRSVLSVRITALLFTCLPFVGGSCISVLCLSFGRERKKDQRLDCGHPSLFTAGRLLPLHTPSCKTWTGIYHTLYGTHVRSRWMIHI